MDGLVGVLCCTAAHAAGIIGKDAAHHASVDGRRVGTNAPSMRFEHVVDEPAYNTGLKSNFACMLFYAVLAPMLGNIHEDAIRHRLPGETRPCGAERHRGSVLLAELEQCLNLANGIWLYHRLRHQSKIRGIVGVGNAVNKTVTDARGREDGSKGCGHENLYQHFTTSS